MSVLCLLASFPFTAWADTEAFAQPLEVKVVVVAMFEHGELVGDRPGEFQFWVERMPLARQIDFPGGPYPLRYHEDGVLGICVGGGIANATASIMALGLDERFDLSRAYWLIAGIAGGDPEDTSIGSAVWAKHVVDGDLLYELDAREIPEDWPYGMIPLGGERPVQWPADVSTGWTVDTSHFALNESLVDWAYTLTRDVTIPDTAELLEYRKAFKGFPQAQKRPRVQIGDTLASSTYWHGELLNRWANDWVKLYAGPEAEFVTTNMEDSGTLAALRRLSGMGKADFQRTLVLRTVSNFSTPPPGKAASWSATAEYPGKSRPALESAYQVGRVVVDEVLAECPLMREPVPGEQGKAE